MSGGWQVGRAAAFEHEVAEVEKLLAELENGEAIGETWGEKELVTATRSLAAWWRSAAATKRGEARELRAIRDPAAQPPLSLHVTRKVRLGRD